VVWESRALGAACAGSFATAALAALSSAEDGSDAVAGARPAAGAPAPDADPVDTSLVCCLCFELLYEPVTLACQHSTCKECLRNLLRAAEDDEDLRCPTCRSEIDEAFASSVMSAGCRHNTTLQSQCESRHPVEFALRRRHAPPPPPPPRHSLWLHAPGLAAVAERPSWLAAVSASLCVLLQLQALALPHLLGDEALRAAGSLHGEAGWRTSAAIFLHTSWASLLMGMDLAALLLTVHLGLYPAAMRIEMQAGVPWLRGSATCCGVAAVAAARAFVWAGGRLEAFLPAAALAAAVGLHHAVGLRLRLFDPAIGPQVALCLASSLLCCSVAHAMLSSPSPEGGGEPQLTCAHDPPGAFAGESEASAAPLAPPPPPPPPPPLSLPLPLGLGVAVSLCTLPKFVLGHSDERGSLLYRQTVTGLELSSAAFGLWHTGVSWLRSLLFGWALVCLVSSYTDWRSSRHFGYLAFWRPGDPQPRLMSAMYSAPVTVLVLAVYLILGRALVAWPHLGWQAGVLASLPTLYFMLLMLSVEDQRLVDIRLDPRIPRRRPPAVPGGPRRHPFDLAYYALSLAAPLASIPLSRHPGWRWLAEAAVWCSGGSVLLAWLVVRSDRYFNAVLVFAQCLAALPSLAILVSATRAAA